MAGFQTPPAKERLLFRKVSIYYRILLIFILVEFAVPPTPPKLVCVLQ